MNIEFLAPAETELIDATAYYNLQSEGLGFEFAVEVKRTIERIIQLKGLFNIQKHGSGWLIATADLGRYAL